MLTSHVDDFLYSGEQCFLSNVINKVEDKYTIRSQDEGSFEYVGIHLTQSDKGIRINQHRFEASVDSVKLSGAGSIENSSILDANEKEKYP